MSAQQFFKPVEDEDDPFAEDFQVEGFSGVVSLEGVHRDAGREENSRNPVVGEDFLVGNSVKYFREPFTSVVRF